MSDTRRHAPATMRNREPILAILRHILPPTGTVLEIASGTGEHAIFFARHLPGLDFQPSDADAEARASIDSWRLEAGLANLHPPIALDVMRLPWPIGPVAGILCINMIHIAPWAATRALMTGAAAILAPGAPLYLYGPFKRNGAHTAPSNAAFDGSLRARDPNWGIRDLDAVADLARDSGFGSPDIAAMPANNLSLTFRRT
jgi:hypothetical protein